MSELDEAQALLERARAFVATGRYGDAVTAFDTIVDRFGTSADPSVDSVVGDALFWKAQSLQQIERDEAALPVYEQMAERYRGRADFRGLLSRALVQKGMTLRRLGRSEDALAAWDDVLASFPDVDEPPLAMGVAMAYDGKAAALRLLDRPDEAIQVYDDLIVRFSDSRFPVLRHRTDAALSEKVFVLLLNRRYDEAIVVANAAIERFEESADPSALAIAVLNLGGALANEQRFDEAIGVYDALIERLDGTDAPALRALVILAISNKVEALVALDREEEAAEIDADLLERYGDEVPRAFDAAAARNAYDETARGVVAGMLLKQALALAKLDHTQHALAVVDNMLHRFGHDEGPEFERVVAAARELREHLLDDES